MVFVASLKLSDCIYDFLLLFSAAYLTPSLLILSSIGLIYIDVLITYKGWRAPPANSPAAAPLKNLVTDYLKRESWDIL